MCATSTVAKLRLAAPASLTQTKTNSSIIEIPVTISGFIIGMLVTVMIALFAARLFNLKIPTAATVPITVAISEDDTASRSVFFSAASVAPSRNSSRYQ